MKRIIPRNKGLIPACDVSFIHNERLIEATYDIPEVVAFKLPQRAGRKGWETWVREIRKHTSKPILIDTQKWIPDPVKKVNRDNIRAFKDAGIDAAFIFPVINFENLEDILKTAQNIDFGIIVGGEMTTKDKGRKYLLESIASGVYYHAAELGITDFVVPGTKPDRIECYKNLIASARIQNPVFYSPGFIAQGGKITKGLKAAGKRFHAIVGRGIYWNKEKNRLNNVDEMRKATLNLAKKLQ